MGMDDTCKKSSIDEFRIRELPVGALLEMFDPQEEVSEEDWEFLREVLSRILSDAAGFYDDFGHPHYEFALGVADNVLNGTPESVIQAMAGTAYFMLTEEAKDFGAETRARLERIRDAHPEFAEDARKTTEPFSIEAMLSDTVLQARLVKWAVAFTHNELTPARPDVREVVMHACKQVCAIWRQTIFRNVLAQLEAADNKAAAE